MKQWILVLALTSVCLGMSAEAADEAQDTPNKSMSQAQQGKLLSEAKDLLDQWDGSGNYLDKAFKKIDQVLKANPSNVNAHVYAAYYYLNTGYKYGDLIDPKYFSKATAEADVAQKLDPKSVNALLLRANLALKEGNAFSAMIWLNEVVKIEPSGNPDFYPLAIETCTRLTNPACALSNLQEFEDLLAKKGKFSKRSLAQLYGAQIYLYKDKDLDKVEGAHKKMIALDPSRAWSHGNYADFLLYRRGDPDAAIKEANAALKLMKYGMAEQVLANALYAKGVEIFKTDRQKGLEYIEEAMNSYLDKDSLMIYAAQNSGNSTVMQDVVLYMLNTSNKSIDTQDEQGNTGLILAADSGNVKSVEWLIQKGADPEIKDHFGHTAMYLASARNFPEAVKTLGKLKAKPDVTDKTGSTPLVTAIVDGFEDVANALLSIGANPNYIGVDPNNKRNVYIPLTLAAEVGNKNMVETLLAAGADPKAQLPGGQTAAAVADSKGHKDIASLIQQAMQHLPMSVSKPKVTD